VSVYVTAYVWEHSSRKGTELLLLLAIADIADKNGVAYPGVKTLAGYIRMSGRNTQRALAKLERSGEISVRRNGGPNGTHLFQVRMNHSLPLFAPEEGGDKLSGDNLSGDTRGLKGVTPRAQRGDIAMTPEPSVPIIEPSTPTPNHSKVRKGKTTIPVKFEISEGVMTWAREHGYEPHLEQHHAYFVDYARSNGKLYLDWDATFRNCIRADWGGVRKNAARSIAQKPTARSRLETKCIYITPETTDRCMQDYAVSVGKILLDGAEVQVGLCAGHHKPAVPGSEKFSLVVHPEVAGAIARFKRFCRDNNMAVTT
jgi:hypothetical protein